MLNEYGPEQPLAGGRRGHRHRRAPACAGVDPLGQEIRVDGWTYQVIGVGKKKGKTLGQSRDNYVMIPITAYLKQYGAHNDSVAIWGKATATGAPLSQAIDEARVALRAHRHDRPGEEDSFEIETNASLLSIWSGLSGTFFMATIGIAAVSLVVGGIVIMNIMLVVGHGAYARNRHSQGPGRAP